MTSPPDDARSATRDAIRAHMLIHAYRVRGHTEADLDPLGLQQVPSHPDLDPATYGFGTSDLDRPIYLFLGLGLETATLREILATARQVYCGTLGVEFMHIQDPEANGWLQDRLERVKERSEFTDRFRKSIGKTLKLAGRVRRIGEAR